MISPLELGTVAEAESPVFTTVPVAMTVEGNDADSGACATAGASKEIPAYVTGRRSRRASLASGPAAGRRSSISRWRIRSVLTCATRIRSLHGCLLSPANTAHTAAAVDAVFGGTSVSPDPETDAVLEVTACCISRARTVANSSRRTATCVQLASSDTTMHHIQHIVTID